MQSRNGLNKDNRTKIGIRWIRKGDDGNHEIRPNIIRFDIDFANGLGSGTIP